MFSLPFVIVKECGILTPPIMALIAIAFFGLDQVGAELEGPFGTDDNDFPLLHMGLGLVDNMDSLVRVAKLQAKLGLEKAARQKARTSWAASQSHLDTPRGQHEMDVDDFEGK